MKLCREIGLSIPGILVINDSDSVPSGFEDCSSIVNWCKYKRDVTLKGYDYKFIREEIKKLYNPENWETLSDDEKRVLCYCFIADYDKIAAFINDPNQVKILSDEYHETSKRSRQTRYDRAVSLAFRSIIYTDVELIINDIRTNRLDYDYIEHGREGIYEANNSQEGIFNYIKSTAGTSYENAGLLQKSLTFVATSTVSTVSNLSDALMTILKDGIY